MRLPLSLKIAATLMMIILIALALTLVLNLFKFEEALRNVTESRLSFIANDLETRIQTGLDLGLELSEMDNVQNIIASAALDEADIVGIDVFDDAGTILFSSDRTRVGDDLEGDWRAAYEAAAGADWEIDDHDAIVVGTTLTNNFDAVVGGLVLRYASDVLHARLDGMFALLLRSKIVLVLLMTSIGLALATVILAGTTGSVSRVRDALERFLREPETAAEFRPRPNELEMDYARTEAELRARLSAAGGPGEPPLSTAGR
jgi:hypothetical protein